LLGIGPQASPRRYWKHVLLFDGVPLLVGAAGVALVVSQVPHPELSQSQSQTT
jgi:hypothetical protein